MDAAAHWKVAEPLLTAVLKAGGCLHCALRAHGTEGANRDLFTTPHADLQAPLAAVADFLGAGAGPCTLCMGLLPVIDRSGVSLGLRHGGLDALAAILAAIKETGHELSSFRISVSLPSSVSVREQAVLLALQDPSRSPAAGFRVDLKGAQGALQTALADALTAVLNVPHDPASDLCIEVTVRSAAADELAARWLQVRSGGGDNGGMDRNYHGGGGGGRKRQRQQSHAVAPGEFRLTNAAAQRALAMLSPAAAAALKGFAASGLGAEGVAAAAKAAAVDVALRRDSIFFSGRYVKLSREVPQSPWTIEDAPADDQGGGGGRGRDGGGGGGGGGARGGNGRGGGRGGGSRSDQSHGQTNGSGGGSGGGGGGSGSGGGGGGSGGGSSGAVEAGATVEEANGATNGHSIDANGSSGGGDGAITETPGGSGSSNGGASSGFTRKGVWSVHEIVAEPFERLVVANGGGRVKFHGAGREDIDVRMLGDGRPFVLELVNSTKGGAAVAELLPALQAEVNALTGRNAGGLVEISGLAPAGAGMYEQMGTEAAEKRKWYRCVVWASAAVTKEQLAKLEAMTELKVAQKTPIRVLHRRTLSAREKVIHKMECEQINAHYLVLRLSTSAGTYVKEFVHGDLGRTIPSFASLLGCRADILQLDVDKVEVAAAV